LSVSAPTANKKASKEDYHSLRPTFENLIFISCPKRSVGIGSFARRIEKAYTRKILRETGLVKRITPFAYPQF
jgi:hypothetical protein